MKNYSSLRLRLFRSNFHKTEYFTALAVILTFLYCHVISVLHLLLAGATLVSVFTKSNGLVCQLLENSKINSISIASPQLQNLTRKLRKIGFSEITFVIQSLEDLKKFLDPKDILITQT